MNYSEIKYFCASNGPGVRTALYVSGCNLHCKGCFNHSTWDFESGAPFTKEVQDKIISSLEPDYIQGLSILGGEPMDPKNQECVADLIFATRLRFGRTKSIWLWTGYDFKHLPDTPHLCKILQNIDVLVDGPFIESLTKGEHRFAGSTNQRILYKGKDF